MSQVAVEAAKFSGLPRQPLVSLKTSGDSYPIPSPARAQAVKVWELLPTELSAQRPRAPDCVAVVSVQRQLVLCGRRSIGKGFDGAIGR